jgi:guanine nucleotide-binding protein G(i) subunit alpha
MGNKPQTKVLTTVKPKETDSKENLKIFIIGATETGKSCLFEQIKKFHSSTIEEKEEEENRVHFNILHTTNRILEYLHFKEINHFEDPDNLLRAKKILELINGNYCRLLFSIPIWYTEEIHQMVWELWKEKILMETLEQHGNTLHLNENFQYFLDRFDKFKPPDYYPTWVDLLHCHRRTTGIQCCRYIHQDVNVAIYDIGGLRGERRKCYNVHPVSCVLFVASLSEYDQICCEDDVTNRMLESIEWFEEQIHSNRYKTLPIFLFLTKHDIFKRKIAKKDLTCVFPEYKGGNDEDAAIDFIKMKYKNEIKIDPQRLQIFVVNSLDEDSVMEAFGEVENQMLEMIKMKE